MNEIPKNIKFKNKIKKLSLLFFYNWERVNEIPLFIIIEIVLLVMRILFFLNVLNLAGSLFFGAEVFFLYVNYTNR